MNYITQKRSDCSEQDYSDTIFSPKAGDIYHLGDMMNISFYGGKPDEGDAMEPSIFIMGLLDYTATADESNISAVVSPWEVVSGRTYYYYPDSQRWQTIDDCGNTMFTYNWTIERDLYLQTDKWYMDISYNDTFISPNSIFHIISDDSATISSTTASSTLSPTSSTKSNTITATTQATAKTQATAGTKLSTGAKAGIGLGASVAVILVVLVVVLFRRHTSKVARQKALGESSTWAKSELDGTMTQQPIRELQGTTLDDAPGSPKLNRQKEPIELPA